MNGGARPAFGKGVRLRRDPDGSAMLLVPEGVLMLNPAAAATLELVDGNRSVDDIVVQLVEGFDVDEETARDDVNDLLDRLEGRCLIVAANDGES